MANGVTDIDGTIRRNVVVEYLHRHADVLVVFSLILRHGFHRLVGRPLVHRRRLRLHLFKIQRLIEWL